MTVPSEVNRSGPYLGNGVTTVFGYGFKIVNQAHLRVIRTDAAGNETVLTLGTHYTVAGVGNAGGGSITVSPAPASGQSITILRAMPFTQNLDLENQGAYYAEDVERAFDEAAMRDQQLAEGLERAVKVPSSTDDPDGTLADRLALGIMRLADSADQIDTVAGIAPEVVIVAGIAPNVTTVAGIAPNVTAVAGVADDIPAVAGVADDIPTIAENIEDVTNFGKVYLGPKTSDPTTRNNGTALMAGDLYFNTVSKMLRVFDGTAWQAAAGQSLNMAAQSFTGNGSATAFTLAMAPAVAANVIVWVGGVRQVPITDYTVSGSTLTFVTAPGNGEAIDTLVVSTVSKLPLSMQGMLSSRADVAVTAIDNAVGAIVTAGYHQAGDGGGATYKRVSSEPTHAGKVKSADGAWWEIGITFGVDVRAFGGVSGGNIASALNAALQCVSSRGGGAVLVPAGSLWIEDTVTIPSRCHVFGSGMDATQFLAVDNLNKEMFTTPNTATLWDTGSHAGASYWGLYDVTINGRAGNQTSVSSHGIFTYSRSYIMRNVKIVWTKGSGLLSGWGPGAAWSDPAQEGSDAIMEAVLDNVLISYCGKEGVLWYGPHDSRWNNVIVGLCSQNIIGAVAGIVVTSHSGGLQAVNCHSWGDTQSYAWDLWCGYLHFSNCEADDARTALVNIQASYISWHGGIQFGAVFNSPPLSHDLTLRGFVIGRVDGPDITGLHINTTVLNCPQGAIDFIKVAADGNVISITGRLTESALMSGSVGYWGTAPSLSDVSVAVSNAAGRKGVNIRGSGGDDSLRFGIGHIYHPVHSGTPTVAWKQGMSYFDSSTKKLRVYDGTAWIDLH